MSEEDLGVPDRYLLARIATGNEWLRALLCTLARQGTQLRRDEPARATEVIRQLSPWPWFKAGQFLFDLMEWEDFMVDGPPPPPLHNVLRPENWERLDDLAQSVRRLLQAIPGAEPTSDPGSAPGTEPFDVLGRLPSVDTLPPLEPGLHLYRDVVLGVWLTATTARGAE